METIPNFLQKQDFLQENLFRDADEQSAEQAVGQPAVAASYDSGELGRIVRAIRQAVDPERVVLFGSLAGAMPFSEMAAYDLLVVTPMHPTMEWLDLHGYLKFKYPTRSRAISFINLHLYSAAEAVGKMKWFYRMALSEGKVLYSRETVVRNPCNYEKFYFAALDRYELFSGQAGGFLAAAGRSLAAGDFRQRLIAATDGDSVRSHVTGSGRIQVWSMACPVTDRTGRRHICGIDFPLPEIYTCMTQSPASSGYATLFDPEGVIVYHPDSLKLGRPASDSTGLAAFRKVAATGQSVTVHAISDYLNIDEERIYYPIQLGGRRWVAGIGIPRLVIEQEIDDFHFYTVFAAVISVLFFAVLLVLAQRRWRREYDLRRHSERESAQLHLQQLLEQIDPHFLFNSLNSLYALIRCNPDQAREFTLTLSRVYRRVLERRKQILSTLAEEIDFTWQYYTLQKIRFDDRIELTSAIDPALRNWRIPSMSLQTLVENAVKHNSITGGNPLHIRIRTEGESFLIENNYTPRSDGDKESLGMGLERIRSVYRFYTEENISISVGDGTFRCRLPLLPPEK